MDLILFCTAWVFTGITMAFFCIARLLTATLPNDDIGASCFAYILSTLWLIPLGITGTMFGLLWL